MTTTSHLRLSRIHTGSTELLSDKIRALKLPRPPTVESGTTVREVIQKVQREGAGCVLVSKDSRPIGIITERDVLLKVLARDVLYDEPVDAFMTRDPRTLTPDDTIGDAISLMNSEGFRNVPIINASTGEAIALVSHPGRHRLSGGGIPGEGAEPSRQAHTSFSRRPREHERKRRTRRPTKDNDVQELDRVTIRFAGDSGDGSQVAGLQFTNTSALFGNDISTVPDFPAEIRAPAGSLPGVSSFQVSFSSYDIHTPGDAPGCARRDEPGGAQGEPR